MEGEGTPPKRSAWGSLHDYKSSKAAKTTPGKNNTTGIRKIYLGQYDDASKPGCWLRANINGTSFSVSRANPLLSRPEHDLVIGHGYYDFGWNSQKQIHMMKTFNETVLRPAQKWVSAGGVI